MAAIYREELPEMLDILDPAEEENNNLPQDVTDVVTDVFIQNQRRICNRPNHMSPQLHRRSVPGPVPDLLRDWESITEEEIDNFISTEE